MDSDSITRLRDSIVLEDEDGPYQSEVFVRLSVSCHLARALGNDELDGLHRQLVDITRRKWDLLTIVLKLDWMRSRRDAKELDPMVWMLFAANDVNSFLMNVRSLFDHLAKVIRIVSGRQTPQSFNDLRNWVAKDTHDPSRVLDERLIRLISDCDWFEDLRDLRDDILHRAAETTVFPELPYLGIQIHKGITDRLIAEPGLLDPENANVAIFERFAIAALSRLHVLLEEVSSVVMELLAIPDAGDGARSFHGGLGVIHQWCEEALAAPVSEPEWGGAE
jgi:hypothetical protein